VKITSLLANPGSTSDAEIGQNKAPSLYQGNVKNIMRNGYGIYINGNLTFESIWRLDKINDFVSIKYNNSLSFKRTTVGGSEPVYEGGELIKPVINCYGITKIYWGNVKLKH
jgi:hypothetical protein